MTWADPLASPQELLPASQRKAEGYLCWWLKALTLVLSKSNGVEGQDSFYTGPVPYAQNRTQAKIPSVADHSKCLFLLLEMAEDPSRRICCRLCWKVAPVSQFGSSCRNVIGFFSVLSLNWILGWEWAPVVYGEDQW